MMEKPFYIKGIIIVILTAIPLLSWEYLRTSGKEKASEIADQIVKDAEKREKQTRDQLVSEHCKLKQVQEPSSMWSSKQYTYECQSGKTYVVNTDFGDLN